MKRLRVILHQVLLRRTKDGKDSEGNVLNIAGIHLKCVVSFFGKTFVLNLGTDLNTSNRKCIGKVRKQVLH